METWALFLFTIFGFAFTLWFLLRCGDIFWRNHELDFIETAQGVIAQGVIAQGVIAQGVIANEDDIIGLTEANIV